LDVRARPSSFAAQLPKVSDAITADPLRPALTRDNDIFLVQTIRSRTHHHA